MPYFKPETLALTILLALVTAIGPLATDMYLPVLPAIRAGFSATTAETQATLSAFMVGFALAQLFYGPISDRKGRRPAMLVGMALFTIGSIACALAPSIEGLIAARAVQALGGAGSVVLARAMVRDAYEGARAARELSRMGSIMALVPAVAPILGAVLAGWFGWRSLFWFMALIGPLMAAIIYARLPETLTRPLTDKFSAAAMVRDFRAIARVGAFRFYALLGTFAFAGFFCFLSGASFVLQNVFGLGARGFAGAFVLTVLGYMVGVIIAQRLVMRIGIDRTIRAGVLLMLPAAALMTALVGLKIGGHWAVTATMPLYQLGMGLVLSQCNAGALMPFRHMAGSASSLFSVTQMSLAALIGGAVGAALDATPLALPLGILACAAAMAVILWVGKGVDAPVVED